MCAGVAALLRLHQPQHGPVHAGGERRGGRGQGLAGARPVDGDHPRGGEHSTQYTYPGRSRSFKGFFSVLHCMQI